MAKEIIEVHLSVPFEAVCMDAKNRPQEIPANKWLTKDKKYTVIGVGQTLDGKLGFKLEEIELDESCYPFDCFNPKRFGIPYQPEVNALENELAELGIEVQELELEEV